MWPSVVEFTLPPPAPLVVKFPCTETVGAVETGVELELSRWYSNRVSLMMRLLTTWVSLNCSVTSLLEEVLPNNGSEVPPPWLVLLFDSYSKRAVSVFFWPIMVS